MQIKDIKSIDYIDADQEFLFKILEEWKFIIKPIRVKIYLKEPIDFTKKYEARSMIQSIKVQKKFRCKIIESYKTKRVYDF